MINFLQQATLESISQIIGNMFSGTEITTLLNEAIIPDISQQSTKWRRLNDNFIAKQNSDRCANNIINFVKIAFNPIRHINNKENFDDSIVEINKILSFEGIEVLKDGNAKEISKTTTISEAKQRANRLKEELRHRKAHNSIFVYCGDEINEENYFHLVFEATKSIFDRIREITGLTSDGSDLIDEAFSFSKGPYIPYLALNKLETESEKSEQRGFMNLIKGVYGAFKNPKSHDVKIKWIMKEDDVLDTLSLISMIHRKIDLVIEARKIYESKINNRM
jgi:uncharacterized protein (TIGR02391 family)